MTRVLPEPAPATTTSGLGGCTTAASCPSFSSRASVSREKRPAGSRTGRANRSSDSTGCLYSSPPQCGGGRERDFLRPDARRAPLLHLRRLLLHLLHVAGP